MTILLKGSAKVLRSKVTMFAFALIMFAPVAAFCQDQDEEVEAVEEQSSGSSSVWQDESSTSGYSTSTTPTTPGSASPTQVNPVGSTSISRGAPQITDTDPTGNPDVPFDTNMNIAFLLSGVLFAAIVLKKRLKPAVVQCK